MPSYQRSRTPGLLFTVTALATAFVPLARAQTTAPSLAAISEHSLVELDRHIVSASRTPQDPKYVASSVAVVPLAALQTAQVYDLRTALAQTPGVSVASYGAPGGQSLVYIRGGSTAQTLIVVDGVRVSARQTDFYGRSILGGESLAGLDRVEVLRGPQGTLYGSAAMGGVILMETTHGCGDFSGSLEVGAGSFETASGALAVQGGLSSFGYSASIGHLVTDNKRPGNADSQWNYSTRLEGKLSPALLAGVTFRGSEGDAEQPGSISFYSPGEAAANSYLATAYVQYSGAEHYRSRLTYGWHQLDYSWLDLSGSPFASNSYNRNTRRVIDWQNTFVPAEWATVIAGVNAEWSHFKSTSVIDTLKDKSRGLYVSADLHPVAPLSLTAGVRYDHFNTAGDATTGRVGAAYRVTDHTKLRTTLGTGFAAPGLTERYGDSQFYIASASLEPEKSTGWDVGIDQDLFGDALSVGVTYFRNNFRDMIVANYIAAQGKYQWQNVSRARTEGVEAAVSAKLGSRVTARVAATYLDVYDTTGKRARVAYKPRKSGDVDVQWQATKVFDLGAGLHYVADRMRTATTRISDYSSMRVYAGYEVAPNLLFKLRVENALNRSYEEIYGYPSLPRGVFGAVEWKF